MDALPHEPESSVGVVGSPRKSVSEALLRLLGGLMVRPLSSSSRATKKCSRLVICALTVAKKFWISSRVMSSRGAVREPPVRSEAEPFAPRDALSLFWQKIEGPSMASWYTVSGCVEIFTSARPMRKARTRSWRCAACSRLSTTACAAGTPFCSAGWYSNASRYLAKDMRYVA